MRIGIIGNFGGGKPSYDGQTIKTVILREELKNNTDYKFFLVDTYYLKHSVFKLLFDTLKCIHTCKDVILILSENGKAVYFPIMYYAKKIFGTRVYHNVIAGGLPEQTLKHRGWKKYLNSFCVNWVELDAMKKKLEKVGVDNCRVLANFKRVTIIDDQDIRECNDQLRLCTFSRVMEEKGIEDAVQAVRNINEENGDCSCVLDIYGQIDVGYVERFNQLIKTFPEYISYKGIVDFKKSVDVIKDYDILLFPTHFTTEGFPGTLIDAYSAGMAVIASRIPATEELIDEWKDGIIYPNQYVNNLEQSIEWAIGNKEKINRMKHQSLIKAHIYAPENVVKQMRGDIEEFSAQ